MFKLSHRRQPARRSSGSARTTSRVSIGINCVTDTATVRTEQTSRIPIRAVRYTNAMECKLTKTSSLAETECHEYYCVNNGQCYIQAGQEKCLYCTTILLFASDLQTRHFCRCPNPFYGVRCEKTYYTPKPVNGTTPPQRNTPGTTVAPVMPTKFTQFCDPDTDKTCWCLDSSQYRNSHYCTTCTQTFENSDVCVCNRAGQCHPTTQYVMAQTVGIPISTTRPPVVVVTQQRGGDTGSSSSSDGK